MSITIIKEATHGWRVKKLKLAHARPLTFGEKWTPGPHNCTAATWGNGCFCSGGCMQNPVRLFGLDFMEGPEPDFLFGEIARAAAEKANRFAFKVRDVLL